MHILLVEDDRTHMRIVNSLFDGLPLVQRLDKAYNYQQALLNLNSKSYNVALVDIKLQDTKDGIDLCQYIRKVYPETIIILITGYDKLTRLTSAYNAGCFDYVRKPYSRVELKLKVLRWSELMACKQSFAKKLEYNGLVYDFDRNIFLFDNQFIKLSKGCRQILRVLIASPERVMNHQEIQRLLWGDHDCSLAKRDISDRINSLRRQLPDEVAEWVHTVFNEGYVLRKIIHTKLKPIIVEPNLE
jgi:DNA-binding response OmpR family regulator